MSAGAAARCNMSARERLLALPPVFRTTHMVSLWGLGRNHADVMVKQWRDKGLVRTLGRRMAGVHFNLVREPSAPEERLHDAAWLLLGAPTVLVGGMALNEGEWTTQFHRLREACVGVTPRLPTVPTGMEDSGLRVLPRPGAWMHALMEDADRGGRVSGGFPMVSPAMALADALLADARDIGPKVNAPKPWLPDPDDLEIPDEEGFGDVLRALRSLGASEGEMELAEPYRESVFGNDAGWRR